MITSLKELREYAEKCVDHDDQGHWKSVDPIDFTDNEGFIYAVHCTTNGMWYVGRKTFKKGGKKTRTVKGKRVKNPSYGKDTGWRDYKTSSENIKKDLLAFGPDAFEYYHLSTSETKGCLTYSECNILHTLHVMTLQFENGDRVFYNNNVGAVRFIPKTSRVLEDKEPNYTGDK